MHSALPPFFSHYVTLLYDNDECSCYWCLASGSLLYNIDYVYQLTPTISSVLHKHVGTPFELR